MTTPAQWELAGSIVDEGAGHAAFAPIASSWQEVLARLEEVRKASGNLRRIGAGRTEDGTLLVARVVPALEELAREAGTVARQMRERLG